MDVQSELKGKKLLLMSGSQDACEIVKEAKKLGIIVYATDYYETSPVKKIADKSFMVSTADVDAIVDLCKKEQVDGIFSGYTDSVLPFMQQVAEKMKIPFWGTAANIDMCINKEKFKEACERSGVPVVPWRKVNEYNYNDILKDIHPPVVFKPVDNSGSRGVFKCYKEEEMKPLCEKSFSYSKSKLLLVEQLMNAHNEFSVYYIMAEGKYFLTGMGDRYVYEISPEFAPVGQGMLFPSNRLAQWIEEMDPCVRRFFKNNGMTDGFVFIQGFYESTKFYIHEIGYRLNGGFTYKLVDYFSKYNQVQQLISYSLTGKMDQSALQKSDPFFGGGIGMVLTATLKRGRIQYINGIDVIKQMPEVVDFCQLKFLGAEIISQGTTAEVFAFIILATKTKSELQNVVIQIEKQLIVMDENEKNMLNPMIDPDKLKS